MHRRESRGGVKEKGKNNNALRFNSASVVVSTYLSATDLEKGKIIKRRDFKPAKKSPVHSITISVYQFIIHLVVSHFTIEMECGADR